MMLQTIAAVIVANGALALFAFAIFVTWKKQTKEHLADSELPLWVYPCLIAAPAFVAFGFFLIPAP